MRCDEEIVLKLPQSPKKEINNEPKEIVQQAKTENFPSTLKTESMEMEGVEVNMGEENSKWRSWLELSVYDNKTHFFVIFLVMVQSPRPTSILIKP